MHSNTPYLFVWLYHKSIEKSTERSWCTWEFSADCFGHVTSRREATTANNYQVMWGVHPSDPDSSHHHMHILLNSVNLMNGTLFHSGPYEVNGFCNHVKTITGMVILILPSKFYLNIKEMSSFLCSKYIREPRGAPDLILGIKCLPADWYWGRCPQTPAKGTNVPLEPRYGKMA